MKIISLICKSYKTISVEVILGIYNLTQIRIKQWIMW